MADHGENVEYKVAAFSGAVPGSMGWSTRENQALYQAEVWMNARAKEGWRLVQMHAEHATYVTVVMSRSGRRPNDGE